MSKLDVLKSSFINARNIIIESNGTGLDSWRGHVSEKLAGLSNALSFSFGTNFISKATEAASNVIDKINVLPKIKDDIFEIIGVPKKREIPSVAFLAEIQERLNVGVL